ncbi:MAG: hypothetical protein KA004_16000 [Verrucomicrobiales bacterium]|nr:hypothetical protein [Verrucomicrobiales bacterium]
MKALSIAALLFLAQPLTSAEVQSLDLTWHDAGRNREVPVRIYSAATDRSEPSAVVIFSHGLGGSREGYGYLGRHWAENGFISVHPQHVGSDSSIWQNGGIIEATQPARLVDSAVKRAGDVRFVLDELAKLNAAAGPLQHRFKLDAIGMAGHSFGANTTLLVSGMTLWYGPGGQQFYDPRLKAALVMSPQAQRVRGQEGFATFKLPIFHMTGTEDTTPLRGKRLMPEERLDPYKWITGVDQCLLVFEGGDHMVFSGRTREPNAHDAAMQEQIKRASLAWWKWRLLGDKKAESWLRETFPAELGKLGRFHFKAAENNPAGNAASK